VGIDVDDEIIGTLVLAAWARMSRVSVWIVIFGSSRTRDGFFPFLAR
jgi:hypothetical protein